MTQTPSTYRVHICELEDEDDVENWLGPEYANATPVATVVVFARSRPEAAARGYVRALGRDRARQLAEMNAPRGFIWGELNARSLASRLESSADWAGPCFRLGNVFQTWHLRVKKIAPSGSQRRRLAAYCARRARRFLALLNAGLQPSSN